MDDSYCGCNTDYCICFTTGSIINATTHGKIVQWITQLFGAEIVTRENRSLIGKEINDNSVPEVTYNWRKMYKTNR